MTVHELMAYVADQQVPTDTEIILVINDVEAPCVAVEFLDGELVLEH